MIFGIRSWIRVPGVLVVAWRHCIPKGAGGNPYYFSLTFSYLAESGALFRTGFAFLGLSIVLIIGSLFGDPDRCRPRKDYYW